MNENLDKARESQERRLQQEQQERRERGQRMEERLRGKAQEKQLENKSLSDRELRQQQSREDAERFNREKELMTDAAQHVSDATEVNAVRVREIFRKEQQQQMEIIKKRVESHEQKPVHTADALLLSGVIAAGHIMRKASEYAERTKEWRQRKKNE